MSKIKSITFYLLLLLSASLLVSKTISFFVDSVQGENIKMKMSEWKPAESSLEIIKDEVSYSIEEKINSQNTGVFQQNFIAEKNHYLSFQYKLDSSENVLGFDEPNFLLKINDKYALQDTVESGIWKRGFVNLKNHKNESNSYLLKFVSKNTFDEIDSPSLELKEVATSKFLAKKNDLLKFSVSKNNAEIHLKYLVEENGAAVQKNHVLTSPYEFLITEHFYNNEIGYYSIDSFGNVEDAKVVDIYTDFSSPFVIEDVECFFESDSEINIIFTSPVDSFSNLPAFYEITASSDEVIPLINFKKFGTSKLPSPSGSRENILFKNLSSEENFFTIRSADSAGNYSEISPCFQK